MMMISIWNKKVFFSKLVTGCLMSNAEWLYELPHLFISLYNIDIWCLLACESDELSFKQDFFFLLTLFEEHSNRVKLALNLRKLLHHWEVTCVGLRTSATLTVINSCTELWYKLKLTVESNPVVCQVTLNRKKSSCFNPWNTSENLKIELLNWIACIF